MKSKVILDADGLIKLGKADIVEILVKVHECLIPRAVYEEAIERGKMELYEDAFKLEEMITGTIEVKEIEESPKAEEILKKKGLGRGEKEVLKLFFSENADAIISDDRSFLRLLEKEGINFFNPANAIVVLKKKDKITAKQALKALDRIKEIIRDDIYSTAKAEVLQ